MDLISILLIVIVILSGLILLVFLKTIKTNAFLLKSKSVNFHKGNTETLNLTDYGAYKMKPFELVIVLLAAAIVLFLIGYIFYRSIILAIFLTPLCVIFPKIRVRQIIDKRKNELKLQFKDALQSLSSSLHAGKSIESAIGRAIEDLLIQYDAGAYIIQELEIIARKLESNETIEKAFRDFAERSKLEEIQGFTEILEVCKRTGGNLITAIKSSTDVISDKIEVLNEIQNILAQKKLERNILTVMPIILIFMLSTSAKDFMQPVFTEIAGRAVMTISIVLFAAAYFIAEKITNIEV